MRLFVGKTERVLERKENQTWTPAQRMYVLCFPITYTPSMLCVCRDISPTSELRVEIQMKKGHSFWATHRQMGDVVDHQSLLNDYWSSNEHEFTVLSQSYSPTSPLMSSDRDGQRSWTLASIITC